MKRYWIAIVAVAVGASLSAAGAAAQAPAGAGAGGATQSSSTPHSYNPIKWVKKDPKTTNTSADVNATRNAKLTSKLQGQGLLAPNADLNDACSPIKALGECVAALHAGQNLGLDFNCLKSKMTGVQATGNASCAGAKVRKRLALDEAIRALKPGVNAKAEAKNAERQSAADLREARS